MPILIFYVSFPPLLLSSLLIIQASKINLFKKTTRKASVFKNVPWAFFSWHHLLYLLIHFLPVVEHDSTLSPAEWRRFALFLSSLLFPTLLAHVKTSTPLRGEFSFFKPSLHSPLLLKSAFYFHMYASCGSCALYNFHMHAEQCLATFLFCFKKKNNSFKTVFLFPTIIWLNSPFSNLPAEDIFASSSAPLLFSPIQEHLSWPFLLATPAFLFPNYCRPPLKIHPLFLL